MPTVALGPHSRPHMLAKLDQRTRESRLLAAVRRDLTAHVGGRPSATQRALIERCARLSLYIEAMDRDSMASGTMSERNSRSYLAWSNSLRLALRDLGKAAAVAQPPSLERIIADHRAEDAPRRSGGDLSDEKPSSDLEADALSPGEVSA
jgi:hypothetical protein